MTKSDLDYKDCEKDLPRNKSCVIVVSAQVEYK